MRTRTGSVGVILVVLTLLCGCASSGPPLPPSLDLPAPVSDLHATRKGQAVLLTWTAPLQTTDHETIRHPGPTLICRGSGITMSACGTLLAELPAGSGAQMAGRTALAASYTDRLATSADSHPSDEVTYAVEVLNQRHRGAGLSNQVRVPAFPAAQPPSDFAVKPTAEGVRISWSCNTERQNPGVQYKLRIYRREEGAQRDTQVAEPDLAECNGAPVLDQSFEWEKTYEYRAAVVTVIVVPGHATTEIEGDDTPSARLWVHDVFPPAVPANLQAVFSAVGQGGFIDLLWSPDTDADLAGYNVYRHEEGAELAKVNSELVKTPAYRDNDVRPGKKYFYSISAVDVRGNESGRSEEAGEAVR